ncbi:MAG: serine hydrolase [Planctomycetota bacterium]
MSIGVAALVLAGSVAAQTGLRDDLSSILDDSSIPSLGYAVVRDGEVTEIDVLGDAPRDAAFRIGSISKSVTTVLVLRLAEEGLLDLQTPLTEALPDVGIASRWASTAPILLVDLLEQTSGLPGTSYADYGAHPTDISPLTVAGDHGSRTRWRPGAFFSYANVNHTLAAAAAEKAAGVAFDELVRTRVLEPLGLRQASFDRSAVGERLVESFDGNGQQEERWDLDVRPSGSLVASIDDLAALARFLATDGASGPWEGTEIVRRMRTPERALVARANYPFIYGAGLFPFVENGSVYYGHWGRIDGFQAVFGTNPNDRSGFALVANGADRRAFGRARARIAREIPGTPAQPDTVVAPFGGEVEGWWLPFTDDSAERAWISEVTGLVRVDRTDEGIALTAGLTPWSARALEPFGPGRFRVPGYPIATHVFAEDPAGETYLLGDQQLSLRRISSIEAWLRIAVLGAFLVALPLALIGGLRAFLQLVRGRAGPRRSAWILLGLAAASAGSFMVLHVLWGMLAPLSELRELSRPSSRSVTLAVLSVAWPLASGASLVKLLRGRSSDFGIGRVLAVGIAVVFGVVAAYLATFGFVPLLTWR